ncbi:hypothetical protein ABIA03_003053 [Bradyrhizobium yuanmingense]
MRRDRPCASLSMRSAAANASSAASVGCTERVERSNSLTPSWASSCWINRLAADCVMPSSRAARVMLRVRYTPVKTRNWRNVTFMWKAHELMSSFRLIA